MTAIALGLLLLGPLPGGSQHASAADANVGAGAADPPYEQQLQRLAEILGALHYLRPLCGAEEPSVWRDQMDQILAAEDPTPERRARIVSQFNLGFSSFATVYRTCTPAALAAIERYLLEGKKLTRDITARYGR
ncbi:MAG: TIGR02301 family protein [Candidatus Kaistia colombiensis]|nr:MAG: TIGR02301 family protein [Kaistia sp.]